tara:strand:- start:1417 stop:1890 length:474 start_codon:yes stop_codon:yes gene_type:complete
MMELVALVLFAAAVSFCVIYAGSAAGAHSTNATNTKDFVEKAELEESLSRQSYFISNEINHAFERVSRGQIRTLGKAKSTQTGPVHSEPLVDYETYEEEMRQAIRRQFAPPRKAEAAYKQGSASKPPPFEIISIKETPSLASIKVFPNHPRPNPTKT